MKFFIFLLILLFTYSEMVFSMRPSHRKEDLLKLGFKKVEKLQKSLGQPSQNFIESPLSWPFDFKSPPYQFISNMQQYQTFTNPPYYHAGVDILAQKDQKVFATSSGTVAGGYYSYTDEVDGTTTKYELPYKEALANETLIPWGKFYFEITVTDNFGNTFEYHHIDSDKLPKNILEKILKGGQTIEKGELLGFVYNFKQKKGVIELRHIHYNILNNQGIYLNPFSVSAEIEDITPPNITAFYGTENSFCYMAPSLKQYNGQPLETAQEIIVQIYDLINKGGFSKAPEKIIFEYGDKITSYDFSQSLADLKTGKRPHIQSIYLPTQCNSRSGSESRASTTHNFYYRLELPIGFQGEVKVTAIDQSGNSSTKSMMVKNTIKRNYKRP